MKVFLIIIILLISLLGLSQKDTSLNITMQQAQNIIIETLKEHSYKSKIDGIKKNYIISFNDSMMIISNLTERDSYSTFKIADIDSILIEEKDYNASLIIKLKEGKQVKTINGSYLKEKPPRFYEFILNLSFLSEDLPEKLGDSFRRLAGSSY